VRDAGPGLTQASVGRKGKQVFAKPSARKKKGPGSRNDLMWVWAKYRANKNSQGTKKEWVMGGMGEVNQTDEKDA